ncbi:hypothetical protein FRC09_018750, partial [Ceratobasidium sp. 395]
RQFNSPAALSAHLGDAQVHGRVGYSRRVPPTTARHQNPTSASSRHESRRNSVGTAQSRYGSESDYPTSSNGSEMSLVPPLLGSTFSNQGPGLSNYEYTPQHDLDEQARRSVVQEDAFYSQTSSEYESSTNSHEEMDTDTDGDEDASTSYDLNTNDSSSLDGATLHLHQEQNPAQYHHPYEHTTRGANTQNPSYDSSTQHIPIQLGSHPASPGPRSSREGSFSHQDRKGETETYCRRCGVPSRLGSSHCE